MAAARPNPSVPPVTRAILGFSVAVDGGTMILLGNGDLTADGSKWRAGRDPVERPFAGEENAKGILQSSNRGEGGFLYRVEKIMLLIGKGLRRILFADCTD
jgi:hypothetical protein